MSYWVQAPRPQVVLRHLMNAAETRLTAQSAMCLMAMMCGLSARPRMVGTRFQMWTSSWRTESRARGLLGNVGRLQSWRCV